MILLNDTVISMAATRDHDLLLITVILLLVALFVPFAYHLDLNPFGWSSYEAVWRYVMSISSFLFLNNTLNLLPYYFFNFVFIVQMYRYYQGVAGKASTIVIGLYAQAHPLLLSLPVLLGLPFTIAPGGGHVSCHHSNSNSVHSRSCPALFQTERK